MFGAKAGGKAASAPSTEGVKSSSVMCSPSTTLARQGSLESPSSGTGSLGSAGGLSGGSSPLFNKPSDLTADVISLSHSLASSPASVHSFTSGGLVWAANLSSSSAGSKDTPSYQSMTSLHTSSESIDLPLSHHGSLSGLATGTHEVQSLLMRTGSVRSTLSERWALLGALLKSSPPSTPHCAYPYPAFSCGFFVVVFFFLISVRVPLCKGMSDCWYWAFYLVLLPHLQKVKTVKNP